MKQGLKSRGYTIIEVLIVLAVTGALLISVMVMISGQQGRTEFTQAINDIQAQINDIINNVSTGYYTNIGAFSCSNVGGVPKLNTIAKAQGTNSDCTFLGQAMQFAVNGDASAYNIYNIIGLRQTGGKEVTSLIEANAMAMVGNGVDTTDARHLQYGLKATTMYAVNGSSAPIGTVAFTSSLGKYSGCTGLCSGSQNVELHSVQGSLLGQDKNTGVSGITGLNMNNSPSSITICFESGGSNQKGTITIGGNGRQLNTSLVLASGACT